MPLIPNVSGADCNSSCTFKNSGKVGTICLVLDPYDEVTPNKTRMGHLHHRFLLMEDKMELNELE